MLRTYCVGLIFVYTPIIEQRETDMTKTYEIAYNAAMEASAKFRVAQLAYRSRQIGDAEFLAAKAAFDASTKAFDEARGEVA